MYDSVIVGTSPVYLLLADPVVHEVISRKFDELEAVDPAPMYRFWGPKYARFKREYPIQNQLGEDLRSLLTAARNSRRETVVLPSTCTSA